MNLFPLPSLTSCVDRLGPLCTFKALYSIRTLLVPKSTVHFHKRGGHGRTTGRILKVVDPMAIQKPASKPTPINNSSATCFNLVMGEILMGNSHKRIAVEGAKLVEDAVLVGLQLEKLFLRRNIKVLPTGLSHLLEEEKKQLASGIIRIPEIHRIGETQIKTWSDLTTPPGVVGIFKKPYALDTKLNIKRDSLVPLTLICDNVREPGNLGSIIRTATGVGCEDVYLTKGCVDVWNMKVLRGACGGHFRLPLTTDVTDQQLELLLSNKILQIASTSTARDDKFSILLCDSNLQDKRLPDLPATSFRDIDYSRFSHSFLIIGGETEGLSNSSVTMAKFLAEKKSAELFRVRIPLANGMDSLNSANALGIIMFEVLRGFI